MGMFDTVITACMACGGKVEWQSKGGECWMNKYYYPNQKIPNDVLLDLDHEATCRGCGRSWRIVPVEEIQFHVIPAIEEL